MQNNDQSSDGLFRVLGLITANFQGLEYRLRWFVALMMMKAANARDDHQKQFQMELAFTITSELSFSRLLIMFASLYKHIESDRLPELNALIQKASNAEAKRNQMLHSTWIGNPGHPDPIQIKTSAKQEKNKPLNLKWQIKKMPLKELEAIADALWEVDQEIRVFMLQRGYSF